NVQLNGPSTHFSRRSLFQAHLYDIRDDITQQPMISPMLSLVEGRAEVPGESRPRLPDSLAPERLQRKDAPDAEKQRREHVSF
ncbi:MAG: hypothetical protein VX498_04680, partial [Myxococcota bacterium]|nr:hypothetical protein [Myxococcota bacterium]